VVFLAALIFSSGVPAQESDLADIATALGLPRNASKAEILRAIGAKNTKQQTVTEKVDKQIAPSESGRYEVKQPTLGASEIKGAWYGRAEAVFLFRESLDASSPLAINENGEEAPFEALGSGDLDADIAPGMRLMVGYQLNRAISLELTYMGLHSYNMRGSAISPDGDLSAAYGLDDDSESWGDTLAVESFANAYSIRAMMESHLHNAEFNLRHQVSKMGTVVPTLSAGLRYINVDETFELVGIDEYDDLPVQWGRYKVSADNNMIGLQMGLELTHVFTEWASVSVMGKAGLLANIASGDTRIYASADDLVFSADDDELGLSLVTEAGAYATFRPHKNFDIRIGYNALFLSGVALGSEQFGAALEQIGDVNKMNLNRNGNLLFHGPSFGFTLRF